MRIMLTLSEAEIKEACEKHVRDLGFKLLNVKFASEDEPDVEITSFFADITVETLRT